MNITATHENPRVGDVGFVFRFAVTDQDDAPFNFTGMTVTVIFKKSDRTVLQQAGTVAGLGGVTYTTADGDLSVAGRWGVQLKAEGGGRTLFSDSAFFKVLANLNS
jgi:hypothetical protein